MTKEEILNIEKGDRFYVTALIGKRLFNGHFLDKSWYTVYKPNEFYKVLKVEILNYKGGKITRRSGIKITTSSEMGINRIYILRAGEIPNYIHNFKLVKESLYQEVIGIDYFSEKNLHL